MTWQYGPKPSKSAHGLIQLFPVYEFIPTKLLNKGV